MALNYIIVMSSIMFERYHMDMEEPLRILVVVTAIGHLALTIMFICGWAIFMEQIGSTLPHRWSTISTRFVWTSAVVTILVSLIFLGIAIKDFYDINLNVEELKQNHYWIDTASYATLCLMLIFILVSGLIKMWRKDADRIANNGIGLVLATAVLGA